MAHTFCGVFAIEFHPLRTRVCELLMRICELPMRICELPMDVT